MSCKQSDLADASHVLFLTGVCKFLVIFEIVEAEAKGQKEGIWVFVFGDFSI